MRKKIILILLVTILLCVIAFIIWKKSQPIEYKPEVINPEVFEDQVYDSELIIGLWQSGSVFYRYNDEGSGWTWDTADDVLESEASKFTWEINKNRLIHFHEIEIGGIIPKAYTITKLDLANIEYKDDYDVKYVFVKVE